MGYDTYEKANLQTYIKYALLWIVAGGNQK
jgi:hypothetical protein